MSADAFARAEHAWLQPPDEGGIGPCRHCPGMCPIDDHWDNDETGEAGCEQHPDCPGYDEYTDADAREDAELEEAGL